jgi:hypothetical protein
MQGACRGHDSSSMWCVVEDGGGGVHSVGMHTQTAACHSHVQLNTALMQGF